MPAYQTPPASGGSAVGSGSGSAGQLNANQSAFAAELVKQTGLDGRVVAAWLLAEEPKSAAKAPNGANNWLNIGDTGSGNFGGANSAWSDPVTAADLTAAWLKGQSMPGFGKASAGILRILSSAGQSPQAQIHALQTSGWAGSGYTSLPSIYNSIDKSTVDAVGHAVTSAVTAPINAAKDAANAVGDVGSAVGQIATLLTSAQFWLRVGEGIAGVLLIYLGLHALTGQSSSVGGQARHVKTKVKVVPVPL